MANLRASKKDIRKASKRKIANTAQKTRLRNLDKNVRKLVAAGQVDEAKGVFKEYTTMLDRAGQKKLIHHKQADRRKSRMAQLLNKTKPSAPVAAAT